MTSSWHLRGTIHQNQNQNQSEHRLRRGRRLSTRSQRTVREHSLSGIMLNWDRSYNHLLSCDSLQWCHLMMHAGNLSSMFLKKGIRWNNPRPGSIYQKKCNCIQLNVIRWFLSGLHDKQSCRLTQLTLWCSHATRPLSHGENHIYSWWWCEKRKLTARRQSGVCSVALSLISASVSHSVALWSFRVVPNTKLLRRYVDTKWWMDKIPRYLVGFDLLIQTEMQVHQNITENHLISPDFLKNIWYWSNTVIGSLPQQQTSSRTRRDGGILHN